MAKKIDNPKVSYDQLEILEDDYLNKVQVDPRFSIEVDPENHFHFSESQKDFIENYVQFKNVPLAAKLAGIEEELGMSYYKNYNIRMEIRRINLAMHHRAFATKMLDMDEIGGYLTSVLIGENLAEADKIGTRDKIQVAKLLMELNKMKREAIADPSNVIDAVDIQEDLSSLSVDTIQKLLKTSQKPTEDLQKKEEVIEEINETNSNALSSEEINHLKTLSTSELLNILEETNKAMQERENNILSNKKPSIFEKTGSSSLTNKLKKYIDESEVDYKDEPDTEPESDKKN